LKAEDKFSNLQLTTTIVPLNLIWHFLITFLQEVNKKEAARTKDYQLKLRVRDKYSTPRQESQCREQLKEGLACDGSQGPPLCRTPFRSFFTQ
jgi:hypothetical protein